MKIIILKAKLITFILLIICSSAFGINAKNAKNSKTININGKEIKIKVLPKLDNSHSVKFTANTVLNSVRANVKQVTTSQYLLDSITNKDITLSPDADVESAIEYKYDSKGRISSEISKEFDFQNDLFIITYKSVYQYGDDFIRKLDYEYLEDSISYLNTKTIFDNAGNVILVKYGVDSLNLESFEQFDFYTYDNNLLKSRKTIIGEATTPLDSTEYVYDSKLRLGSLIEYTLDENDSLVYSTKTEYGYDNSDNLLKQDELYWDEEWVSYANTDYVFNVDNNCTDMIYTEPMLEEFVLSVAYKFEYNTAIKNNNIFSGSAFDEYPFSFQDQMTSLKTTILLNDEALSEYKSDIFYSVKLETGLNNPTKGNNTFMTYSNENKSLIIHNTTTEKTSQVMLYDATGKLVLNNSLKSNNSISASNFNKGLYIYRINNGGNISKGKVLIN